MSLETEQTPINGRSYTEKHARRGLPMYISSAVAGLCLAISTGCASHSATRPIADVSQIHKGGVSEEDVERAVDALRGATGFTTKQILESHRVSEFAWAMTVLMRTPDAGMLFYDLYRSAGTTTAGRLYALMGLRATDPRIYKALKRDFHPEEKVTVWSYDIVSERPIGDLQKVIEKDQTLADLMLEPLPDYAETVRPTPIGRNLGDNKAITTNMVQDAFALLVEAPRVESGFIEGQEEGAISPYAWAFSTLWVEKNSDGHAADFYRLFQESRTPAGRAYALIALRSLDPRVYEVLKGDMPSHAKIPFSWKGETGVWSVRNLLGWIEKADMSDDLFVVPANLIPLYHEKMSPRKEATAVKEVTLPR